MKLYSVVFAFLMLSLLTIQQQQSDIPTFEKYIVDYQKNYTQEEKIYRRQIYDKRVATFSEITFCEPGVNNLTDWTEQQIAWLKGGPLRPLPPSYESSLLASSSSLTKNSIGSFSYNESLDWRQKGAVTSVKNQGSCGSCWAFSVVAHVESKLILQNRFNNSIDLSEQYILTCTVNSTCSGGYPSLAMKIARDGIPKEETYPYSPYGYDGYYGYQICLGKDRIHPSGQAHSFWNVTQDKLIQSLQSGPISVGLSATGWQYYRSGTIFSCPSSSQINHAVLLVGYTPTYWIIKNQWGNLWGDNGYMKLSRVNHGTYKSCYIGYQIDYLSIQHLNFSIVILGIILFSLIL